MIMDFPHRVILYSMIALAIVALAMMFSSCASVVSQVTDGHPNRDHVPVEPGAHAVMMTGTYVDSDRDGWLELPRGAGPFRCNNGVIVKDGETVGHIRYYPNGWLLGNWIYGGIPGVAIDVLGGGAWDLHPYPVKKAVIK